ncbi:MAG: T9SS type A sorting domain-containing protein, partial [Bacteroidota bacterium]
VAAIISLGSGSLTLGAFNLSLGLTAVLDIPTPSASSMIITNGTGELRKSVSSIGTYSFPIGEAEGTAEFTPVTIEISAGTGFSQAVIGVSTANSKSPSNFSSANYLNRYWKLYQTGITGCVITFNSAYASQDVIGQESSIRLASFSGQYNAVTNAWKKIGPIENNSISQGGIQLPAQVSTYITGIGVTAPVASITGGNGPAVCIGSSVTLTGSFTGEGTPSYVWTPAIGLSAASGAQTLAAPATTTTYTLTVFDANGASATASAVVSIQQPTVTAANAEVCTGGTVTLTAAGAVNYSWSPSSGLSAVTGASVTATLTQTAEYLVIGTDASGCADSVRVKVTVNPFPGKAGITGQGLLSDRPVLTSSSATGNQWYRNGTLIQGATNSSYTATESGTYSVKVTAKNCTGPSSDDFVLVIVGLEGEYATGRVYPNPSEGLTTLDLNGFDAARMVTVSVRDAQGKLMLSRLLDTGNPVIDVTDIPSGMYVLTAEQGIRRVVRKIMRR